MKGIKTIKKQEEILWDRQKEKYNGRPKTFGRRLTTDQPRKNEEGKKREKTIGN